MPRKGHFSLKLPFKYDMSHNDHDPIHNTSNNPHFQDVLSQSLQNPMRRGLLRGGLGLAGLAMLPGCATLTSGMAAAPKALGFPSVEKSLLDNVMLPPGYQYSVLHATGDALDSALAAYSNKGTEADDWSRRVGDHHDGMDIYYIDANGRYSTPTVKRPTARLAKSFLNSATGTWVLALSWKCSKKSTTTVCQWSRSSRRPKAGASSKTRR